ncbi:TPA: hypothetical protein ACIAR9_004863, partial [Salmonella enterica subsp. enterica serovar Poona]
QTTVDTRVYPFSLQNLKNITVQIRCYFRKNNEINCIYHKGFPGMSTPVFMVSVCSSVKIKGRDCGTINGHDESSSIRTLMKDAREVLVR